MNVDQQRQHEPLEMDTGRVLLAAAGLVLLLICGFLICGAWLAWLEERMPAAMTAEPMTAEPMTAEPESMWQRGRFRPPVMPNQAARLQQMQQQWRQRLSAYGWVDRQRQVVHIPIERAIELAAAREMSWEWPAGDPAGSQLPAPEDPKSEGDG